MDFRNCVSSEDYMFEIKNNEQLFDGSRMVSNIKPLWSFKGHDNSIEGIHLVGEKEFATISHDCMVSVWSLDGEKKSATNVVDVKSVTNVKNIKLDNPILCSSYHEKKRYLCTGMTNKNENICIIDMGEKKVKEILASQCNSIFCMNYFDENKITYGSKEGSICLIDLNRKKNVYRYEEIGDCLNYCTCNEEYKVHIFSSYKGSMLFFDFRQALPIHKNGDLHSRYSINTVFSDGSSLYSGASDCLVKKFDLRLLDEKRPLEIYVGHTSPIRFLSFSRKYENFFCSSSDNGSIKLWQTEKNVDGVNRSNLTTKTVTERNKNGGKNFLQLNKKTVRSNRSSSIVSECSYRKPPDLFRKENSNRNYEKLGKVERTSMLDTYRKRTLTPNVQSIHDKRVQVMSRNELFNIIKTKNVNSRKEIAHNFASKVYLGNGREGPTQGEIKGARTSSRLKLPLTSQHSAATSKNSTSCRNFKGKNKISISVSNDSAKGGGSQLELKPDQFDIPFLLFNESDLTSSHAKKIKIRHSTLSMLNHRSRVSAMVWVGDLVLSTSWDQTVKCWDVRGHAAE
ncbi:WD domain G-beta repeat domain containing protein [Plasmodium cynomolgi strain B]|uniref:WD domain G-beta repeat domain containing protein n=1 Tax=Plasmodium cynomolgi (strain B) TaxID=1120755 RepID=K6USU4_PLACD|nr:WD domain G-beta repeat domain containing protein [Plasmodium cynomolgi strain B]GAB66329.1 WD domain G-beta repeat domain containing protein [Plasmodium cynomolgi strain B]